MKIRIGGIWFAVGIYTLGFLTGFFISGAIAHPPCDYNESVCHYVQVVNPITGKLEQQYICN